MTTYVIADEAIPSFQSTCEVCGEPIQQIMFHTCEELFAHPFGPWYERREHDLDGVRHSWLQQHNCVRPADDLCWLFPCEAESEPLRTPECCRTDLRTSWRVSRAESYGRIT